MGETVQRNRSAKSLRRIRKKERREGAERGRSEEEFGGIITQESAGEVLRMLGGSGGGRGREHGGAGVTNRLRAPPACPGVTAPTPQWARGQAVNLSGRRERPSSHLPHLLLPFSSLHTRSDVFIFSRHPAFGIKVDHGKNNLKWETM